MGRPLSCPSTLPDVRGADRSTHAGSQSTGAAFIDFPVVVKHQVPTIQTVQKSGEVYQCQHLDRYRSARREAETGPDQPENPEDGREDTGPSAQRHVPIIQKFQKTVETPQELWTVPRILKFQKTVEYATGPCDSEFRRPCTSDKYRT